MADSTAVPEEFRATFTTRAFDDVPAFNGKDEEFSGFRVELEASAVLVHIEHLMEEAVAARDMTPWDRKRS